MSLSLLYLTKADVAKTAYTMKETLDLLEDIYREKAAGNYELPPKIGVHPGEGNYLHAMPCWAKKWETAGIKWGGGFKNNPSKGLDYIYGFVVLNDVETGIPYVMMDATWHSALRTGAKSGMTAKYLMRKDSTTCAILACGKQARRAFEAFRVACPQLTKFMCWDYFPAATEKYVAEMKAKYPEVEIVACGSVEEAVKDADVIQTAAPTTATEMSTITKDMIKPGVVVTAMDGFTLFYKDTITDKFTKFVTDDVPQFRNFETFPEYKGIHFDPAELAQVVVGNVRRENDQENIFVTNIGNAFDDMPVCRAIYEKAKKMGIGEMITF